MALHIELGNKGEEKAALFLREKGYTVICTNWRNNKAEADIIAQKENLLVIVEVKTRSTSFFGSPAEAVGKQKQIMMVKAAEAYLEQNKMDVEVRFDVVSIVMNDSTETIEHIEEAFYPFSDLLDE